MLPLKVLTLGYCKKEPKLYKQEYKIVQEIISILKEKSYLNTWSLIIKHKFTAFNIILISLNDEGILLWLMKYFYNKNYIIPGKLFKAIMKIGNYDIFRQLLNDFNFNGTILGLRKYPSNNKQINKIMTKNGTSDIIIHLHGDDQYQIENFHYSAYICTKPTDLTMDNIMLYTNDINIAIKIAYDVISDKLCDTKHISPEFTNIEVIKNLNNIITNINIFIK